MHNPPGAGKRAEQWQRGSLQMGGNAIFKILVAWKKLEISFIVAGLQLSKCGAAGWPLSAGVPSLSLQQRCSHTPRPGPECDTGIFTTASLQHFLLVQLAAFGNASWGSSFPFHYRIPEVFQALKPLLAFTVSMHPSSVFERWIFTFDFIRRPCRLPPELPPPALTPGCLPSLPAGKLSTGSAVACCCCCRLGRAGGFCHKTTPGCEQK